MANIFMIALKSYEGKYLAAGSDGVAVWNRNTLSDWDQIHQIEMVDKNHGGLKSRYGKYLSAQPDGTIQWNRDKLARWETWLIEVMPGGLCFKSFHGKYLSVQSNGKVTANQETPGSWEHFTTVPAFDTFIDDGSPVKFDEEDFRFLGKKKWSVILADPKDSNRIGGDMSIPEPVKVNCNGDMDPNVFRDCSTIMSVCTNMVQKMITDAAKAAGVNAKDALKNIDAWVTSFVDFPLPLFNFTEAQSQDYKNSEFSLSVNTDAVESVVNIKNVPDLKNAVIGALKKSGGEIARYKSEKRDFTYFAVITAYTSKSIDVRVVTYQMHLQETDVQTLCGGVHKTKLDSHYDTYVFSADANFMQKLSQKIEGRTIDYFGEKLYGFITDFYDAELEKAQGNLKSIFQK
ncbi:MAG: hypothetical protein LBD29_00775 [Treponema sp.]|jgi:hypothetical protein|nr:hypothetical protein [Treponema sp.]